MRDTLSQDVWGYVSKNQSDTLAVMFAGRTWESEKERASENDIVWNSNVLLFLYATLFVHLLK